MVTLAGVVLGLLLIAVVLGIVNLTRWRQHRRSSIPAAKAATHVVLQSASIALWIAFIATGTLLLAWTAFIVITIGQVFGDLLMFASYRARSGETRKTGYGAVVTELLGFKRPLAVLHAVIGALAYFALLVTAIAATIG